MYHQPTNVSSADVPVTFLLSPIKELDTGSLNNTLHPNSPGTIQLAQALQSSGLVAGSPSLSRIITVNAADHSDTSVTNSQLPVLSMIIPTSSSSASLGITAMAPADTAMVHEGSSGSVPSRRRRFEVTRKESLSKSTSLDSAPALQSSASKEAVEKRKSDGGKTGEVYV